MPSVATGPVGIVTGALGGIGTATALELAGRGARLVLADRRIDGDEGLVEEVRVRGGDAVLCTADVADLAQVERLPRLALETFGRLDLLVANAGIADRSPADGGDPERWRQVIETNLLGTLYTVRAVLPQLRAQRSGHVFITASVSGRETYVGEPVYIASKWGLVGYAHALRQELIDDDVRVTLVEPGLVDTPLARNAPGIDDLLAAIEPLSPADVARAIAYAFEQPAHVVVSELTIRPQRQRLSEIPPAAVDPADG